MGIVRESNGFLLAKQDKNASTTAYHTSSCLSLINNEQRGEKPRQQITVDYRSLCESVCCEWIMPVWASLPSTIITVSSIEKHRDSRIVFRAIHLLLLSTEKGTHNHCRAVCKHTHTVCVAVCKRQCRVYMQRYRIMWDYNHFMCWCCQC